MEIAFLRMLDGGPQEWEDGSPMIWGAAMSCIIEDLNERDLVTYPTVEITEKGRAVLRAMEEKP